MVRKLAVAILLTLLCAAPLAAADLWTFRHSKPTFTIGVPKGWEETTAPEGRGAVRRVAVLWDPLTKEKPVPSRLDVFAAASPARKSQRELTVEERRIAAFRPEGGETYQALGIEERKIAGFPAIVEWGDVTAADGRSWRRVEASYQGARNLYAVVYTVPTADFDWLEGTIRASLETFHAGDAPRNPWTAWVYGMGGLLLLVLILVGLHRWYRG